MPNRDPSPVSGGGNLDPPYLFFLSLLFGLGVVGDELGN